MHFQIPASKPVEIETREELEKAINSKTGIDVFSE
jgi:hypothetical protein